MSSFGRAEVRGWGTRREAREGESGEARGLGFGRLFER
jgi:hypothetical protein